jgi:hypothetical protein
VENIVLNPWFKNAPVAPFPPDREVYTLRIVGAKPGSWVDTDYHRDTIVGTYADSAWTSPRGHIGHLFRKDWETEVVKMTVYEYLTEHYRMKGMNPFWDLGRIEWTSKWMRYHNVRNIA